MSNNNGWACAVHISNTPQPKTELRRLAADAHYDKLIEQFGDVEAAALAFRNDSLAKTAPCGMQPPRFAMQPCWLYLLRVRAKG